MTGMPPLDAAITFGTPPADLLGNAPTLALDAINPAQWPSVARPFMEQHVRYKMQRSAFITTAPTETPDEHALFEAMQNHYTRCRVHQLTIEIFAKRWGSYFCHTLKRSPPWATSLGQPYAGMPAFIVSAGPSLDLNGALLGEAQKRGPVICVNTSASACLYHGVVPDVVVACEAANLSDHLAPLRNMDVPVVIDAFAHPDNWDVAKNAWAIRADEPNVVPYMLATGGIPLAYTGSVACAAVALALYWGASPIILLGQDCAYTGGRYYAKGTPYSDLTADVVGDGVVVRGRSKEQEPTAVVWRDSWGGGDAVPSDHSMSLFNDWLSTAAAEHFIVNSTQGGAHIKYSYELPLSAMLAQHPVRSRMPLQRPPASDTLAVRAELLIAAAKVLADPSITHVPSWLPLLNMWTTELGFDHSGMPWERRARKRKLMEMGCVAIVEALT